MIGDLIGWDLQSWLLEEMAHPPTVSRDLQELTGEMRACCEKLDVLLAEAQRDVQEAIRLLKEGQRHARR